VEPLELQVLLYARRLAIGAHSCLQPEWGALLSSTQLCFVLPLGATYIVGHNTGTTAGTTNHTAGIAREASQPPPGPQGWLPAPQRPRRSARGTLPPPPRRHCRHHQGRQVPPVPAPSDVSGQGGDRNGGREDLERGYID
jgi:hypothetical protein